MIQELIVYKLPDYCKNLYIGELYIWQKPRVNLLATFNFYHNKKIALNKWLANIKGFTVMIFVVRLPNLSGNDGMNVL